MGLTDPAALTWRGKTVDQHIRYAEQTKKDDADLLDMLTNLSASLNQEIDEGKQAVEDPEELFRYFASNHGEDADELLRVAHKELSAEEPYASGSEPGRQSVIFHAAQMLNAGRPDSGRQAVSDALNQQTRLSVLEQYRELFEFRREELRRRLSIYFSGSTDDWDRRQWNKGPTADEASSSATRGAGGGEPAHDQPRFTPTEDSLRLSPAGDLARQLELLSELKYVNLWGASAATVAKCHVSNFECVKIDFTTSHKTEAVWLAVRLFDWTDVVHGDQTKTLNAHFAYKGAPLDDSFIKRFSSVKQGEKEKPNRWFVARIEKAEVFSNT